MAISFSTRKAVSGTVCTVGTTEDPRKGLDYPLFAGCKQIYEECKQLSGEHSTIVLWISNSDSTLGLVLVFRKWRYGLKIDRFKHIITKLRYVSVAWLPVSSLDSSPDVTQYQIDL